MNALFNDAARLRLSAYVKPLVFNPEGQLCYIEPTDITKNAFTWEPKF